MSNLALLQQRALAELQACAAEEALRQWQSKYFGKQGEVALALKKVGEMAPGERRAYGQEANRIKEVLTQAFETASAQEKERALAHSLAADALDVTLPGRPAPRGRLHVSTQVMRQICA